jgi:hypothetical protein
MAANPATQTQNMTPDSAMNDQKKSPNESNIYHSFFAKYQTRNDKPMINQVNTPVRKKTTAITLHKNSIIFIPLLDGEKD